MTQRQTATATALLHAFDYAESRSADFTHDPPLPVDETFNTTLTRLEGILKDLGVKKTTQKGGNFHQHTGQQAQLRDQLEEDLADAVQTAISISNRGGDSSAMAHFRLPASHSDANLVTTANSMAQGIRQLGLNAAYHAHGWPADAATHLENLAKAFERSEADQGGTLGEKVGATAAIPGLLRQGLDAVHTLTTIFRRLYKTRPEILAAWQSATHIEKTSTPTRPGNSGSTSPAAEASGQPTPQATAPDTGSQR